MNINTYLEPLSRDALHFTEDLQMPSFNTAINTYWDDVPLPSVTPGNVVLLGLPEGRLSPGNDDGGTSPNAIRSWLYGLATPADTLPVVDLGNLVTGSSVSDTVTAFTEVVLFLMSRECVVVLLGGSQAFTYYVYDVFAQLNRIVNICSIDSRFDIDESNTPHSNSWLYHSVLRQPSYLFGFAHLGNQAYLTGQRRLQLMDNLQFDRVRVGELQEDMEKAEPLLRNADIVSVDVGAVRQSDAPGNRFASPHGLYGEELCQLMRYAGYSDKVQCLGLFETNTRLDRDGQTTHMMAQALWFFLEGVANRQNDWPMPDSPNHRCYRVQLESYDMEVVFYKSKLTDHWWVEVPATRQDSDKMRYLLVVPCTYEDYQQALQNELPERWWKLFERVN